MSMPIYIFLLVSFSLLAIASGNVFVLLIVLTLSVLSLLALVVLTLLTSSNEVYLYMPE